MLIFPPSLDYLAIVAICSWQDAHNAITTPLRKDTPATQGPACTLQYLDGAAWAGNGYRVRLPVPENELARTEALIALYQQRYLTALKQEPGYDPADTGSTDFAVVDVKSSGMANESLMPSLPWLLLKWPGCSLPLFRWPHAKSRASPQTLQLS